MTLDDLSAAVVAFSLLLYVMLDGTDLGVGIILPWFDDDDDRRRLVQSILPVWDANETWIVLTAGALLALFPAAYAQIFNAVYVPLFLMLFCLFARALALEYRGQTSSRAKRTLDVIFIIASLLTGFFQGCIAGLLVSGLPEGEAFGWLSWYPLLSGFGMVAIYGLLGCCWVRWRVQDRAGERATLLAWLFLILALVLFVAIVLSLPDLWLHALATWPGKLLMAIVVVCWFSLLWSLTDSRPLLPLLLALTLMLSVAMMIMTGLYPWLIPDKLSLQDAAASPHSQQFLLTGIAIVMPLTLAYNSWAFWVFRGRVK